MQSENAVKHELTQEQYFNTIQYNIMQPAELTLSAYFYSLLGLSPLVIGNELVPRSKLQSLNPCVVTQIFSSQN